MRLHPLSRLHIYCLSSRYESIEVTRLASADTIDHNTTLLRACSTARFHGITIDIEIEPSDNPDGFQDRMILLFGVVCIRSISCCSG